MWTIPSQKFKTVHTPGRAPRQTDLAFIPPPPGRTFTGYDRSRVTQGRSVVEYPLLHVPPPTHSYPPAPAPAPPGMGVDLYG